MLGGARVAIAAVTPRVRAFVVCDDVSVSTIEDGVFNLEGVRQHLFGEVFPWRAAMSLFFLLSNPRKGKYSGKVLIVNDRNDRSIRYVKFLVTFQENNQLLPLYVAIGDCIFPEPGHYTFEVYFSPPGGEETLKGEQPFYVLSHEE